MKKNNDKTSSYRKNCSQSYLNFRSIKRDVTPSVMLVTFVLAAATVPLL